MKSIHKCPHCGALQPERDHELGESIDCLRCQQAFIADETTRSPRPKQPSPPAAPPTKPIVAKVITPKPLTPKPATSKPIVVQDDDEPSEPVRRARRVSDEDDDAHDDAEDDRPRRRNRRRSSSSQSHSLVLVGVALLLMCMVGGIIAGAWFLVKSPSKSEIPALAQAPTEPERPVPQLEPKPVVQPAPMPPTAKGEATIINADGTVDPVPEPASPEPTPNDRNAAPRVGGAPSAQPMGPAGPNTGEKATPATPPPPGVPGGPQFPFGGGVPGGPFAGGGFPPGLGQQKPEVPAPVEPLPPFAEYPNPHKLGKQTRLKPHDTPFVLPALPSRPMTKSSRGPDPKSSPLYFKLAYSSKHKILAAMGASQVALFDAKSRKLIGTQKSKQLFTDLAFAPDESALFVADFGGENIGYSTPLNPSRVHRYDLVNRTWEDREAPKIAYRIEAIDGFRFILLESDQWVSASINRWEIDGVGIRELSQIGCGYYGDIEYDPRVGRLYHGGTGSSSQEILVHALEGSKLKQLTTTGTYGSASGGGPTTILSQSGTHLYYGKLQFDVTDFKKVSQTYPETIYAASRDIAFGQKSYYRTTTGSKLGDLPFALTDRKSQPAYYQAEGHPAIVVGSDGQTLWAIEYGTTRLHQFMIEAEK